MGALDGRVAVITGAGRGLGREHALLFAAEGAKVVVNDLGGATDGSGSDKTAAEAVVEEIKAMGGEAVANGDSAADWEGGQRLVNNAGILRDRVLVNMSAEEWDAVINVHLRGHFVPSHWAAAYWRQQVKEGKEVNAAIVNTSSGAGLLGNPGQTNYSAAKAGIAAFTMTAAQELVRYGVRVNAIAPLARTRLTLQTPGLGEAVAAPEDGSFDAWDPANVSPLVAYLSTANCPITGGVFHVGGNEVGLFQQWTLVDKINTDGRWTVEGLAAEAKRLVQDRPTLVSGGSTVADLTGGFAAGQ